MGTELYGKEYAEAQKRDLPAIYKEKVSEWLEPKPEDTILEVGSGGSDVVRFLRETSPKTVGSDLNLEALRISGDGGTAAISATDLAIKSESVDKSVSLHTLEHIPDLSKVFKELDRVTKPGGVTMHAFPAFFVTKAEGSLIEAWKMTHNPVKALKLAHQLHIHRLNPQKIKAFTEGTSWKMVKSEKVFVPEEYGSAWFVLLEKPRE